MEGEIYSFVQVWLAVFLSLCYCYLVVRNITHKGFTRLVCVLPVLCLFLALPLKLHSIHLGAITAFFVAWLANFKLLLFAFGKGPLCSDPSISIASFVALACLPIKILQNPPPKSNKFPDPSMKPRLNGQINGDPNRNGEIGEDPVPRIPPKSHKSALNYGTKVLLMGVLLRVYQYSDRIHPKIILFLFCFHIYFLLEISQIVIAALARTLLGIEFERQFNEPYLSTSLQDFWGRRWNLVVTSILRPTVYEPVYNLSSRAVGRRWAALPAVMATFVASAVMHELIFYYLGRVWPTWEITWFFLLHGTCLVGEIALKKLFAGRIRLPAVVSGPLTFGFVFATGFWLFLPQLVRCGAFTRGLEENAAVGAFVRERIRRIGTMLTVDV